MKLSFAAVVVVAGVDGRWKALRDEEDYIYKLRSLLTIECQQKTIHNAIQGCTAYLLCQALTALLLKKGMTYPQSTVYCVKGCGYQYIMSGGMEIRLDDKIPFRRQFHVSGTKILRRARNM